MSGGLGEGGGLSPLARGTLRFKKREYSYRRFIPAGAGNTQQTPGEKRGDAVYPRWRGEHIITGRPGGAESGLSPLARGTQGVQVRQIYKKRFIPAGAGNTLNLPN